MAIKTETPTQEQIDELRNRFVKKLESDPPKGEQNSIKIVESSQV